MTKPNIPENKTIPIADSGNQGGIPMWPSEEWASRVSDWANLGLIVSLVLGVLSTALLVWMGSVKEGYLKRELANTNLRAANLEKDAAALLKQLIEQGPRSHLLYGERKERLTEQLKPFAGQKAEIRYCAVSFNQHFIDNDTIGVTMLLIDILVKAGWSVNPLVRENCSGTGIQVSINPKAPESVRKAADALWVALHAVPLAMIGDKVFAMASPRPEQPPTFDASGKELHLSPLGDDTIVVTVLAHP